MIIMKWKIIFTNTKYPISNYWTPNVSWLSNSALKGAMTVCESPCCSGPCFWVFSAIYCCSNNNYQYYYASSNNSNYQSNIGARASYKHATCKRVKASLANGLHLRCNWNDHCNVSTVHTVQLFTNLKLLTVQYNWNYAILLIYYI